MRFSFDKSIDKNCYANDGEKIQMQWQIQFPLVLTPIKQEYSFKFQLLIKRLVSSLKLSVYQGSICPLELYVPRVREA